MECLVCHERVKPGEQVFWGNQVECSGPGDSDCSYSSDSEGLVGAIHLSCLESPTVTFTVPNTEVSEPVEDGPKPIVERSDALSLLSGVEG